METSKLSNVCSHVIESRTQLLYTHFHLSPICLIKQQEQVDSNGNSSGVAAAAAAAEAMAAETTATEEQDAVPKTTPTPAKPSATQLGMMSQVRTRGSAWHLALRVKRHLQGSPNVEDSLTCQD